MQSLTILGRRWFRHGPGITYYSATIIVDGQRVHQIPFGGGDGSQYEWDSWAWVQKNVKLPKPVRQFPSGSCESPWSYCHDHGIAYTTDVCDVQRKKDL